MAVSVLSRSKRPLRLGWKKIILPQATQPGASPDFSQKREQPPGSRSLAQTTNEVASRTRGLRHELRKPGPPTSRPDPLGADAGECRTGQKDCRPSSGGGPARPRRGRTKGPESVPGRRRYSPQDTTRRP